jgi:hypothetical protein
VFKLFCWFLDGSRNPFSVDIGASKIVDDLKKAIWKENSDFLILWEVGSFYSIVILAACVIITADTLTSSMNQNL